MAPPKKPMPPDVSLGDLDTKNFSYAGGCGFEVPAAPVKLSGGKQTEKTPSFGGTRSTAEWRRSEEVTLGQRQFMLVYLSCTVGHQKLLGAHLIGRDRQRPSDLGIVAVGNKITINVHGGQLDVDSTYRTLHDKAPKTTGTTSYQVAVVGVTPVRLFSGEKAADIDPAIAKLPVHGYDAGLVGISGYVDDPSETNWVIGLLDKPNQVLTADSLGGGYGSGVCWIPTIHTQAGEKIGHSHLAYAAADNATGTAIDLAESSTAAVGVRGDVTLPIKKATPGLLIPPNGVVPALATATTRTADNQLHDAIVTTKAPADAYQDIWRFGAAFGNEYPLPIGAFATAKGRIAMTGAWFNPPVPRSKAGFGMRPVVDPDAVGEKKACR